MLPYQRKRETSPNTPDAKQACDSHPATELTDQTAVPNLKAILDLDDTEKQNPALRLLTLGLIATVQTQYEYTNSKDYTALYYHNFLRVSTYIDEKVYAWIMAILTDNVILRDVVQDIVAIASAKNRQNARLKSLGYEPLYEDTIPSLRQIAKQALNTKQTSSEELSSLPQELRDFLVEKTTWHSPMDTDTFLIDMFSLAKFLKGYLNFKNKNSCSSLLPYACVLGDEQIVSHILENDIADDTEEVAEDNSTRMNFLNLALGDTLTPLQYACSQGNAQIVRMLLDKGADVNVFKTQGSQDPVFNSPLAYAMAHPSFSEKELGKQSLLERIMDLTNDVSSLYYFVAVHYINITAIQLLRQRNIPIKYSMGPQIYGQRSSDTINSTLMQSPNLKNSDDIVKIHELLKPDAVDESNNGDSNDNDDITDSKNPKSYRGLEFTLADLMLLIQHNGNPEVLHYVFSQVTKPELKQGLNYALRFSNPVAVKVLLAMENSEGYIDRFNKSHYEIALHQLEFHQEIFQIEAKIVAKCAESVIIKRLFGDARPRDAEQVLQEIQFAMLREFVLHIQEHGCNPVNYQARIKRQNMLNVIKGTNIEQRFINSVLYRLKNGFNENDLLYARNQIYLALFAEQQNTYYLRRTLAFFGGILTTPIAPWAWPKLYRYATEKHCSKQIYKREINQKDYQAMQKLRKSIRSGVKPQRLSRASLFNHDGHLKKFQVHCDDVANQDDATTELLASRGKTLTFLMSKHQAERFDFLQKNIGKTLTPEDKMRLGRKYRQLR